MHYSEPEIIDITPEMRARLEKFQAERANDPIGKVATSILLEDDNVRIWEMTLEPGEWSDLHHHEHDYYLLIFEGDFVAAVPQQGSAFEAFVGKVPDQGNTVPIPKGGTEWAYNVGKLRYREILIELKNR
jgi:mannose-6-phosphate isomerase-like protein (cupin superfamily)